MRSANMRLECHEILASDKITTENKELEHGKQSTRVLSLVLGFRSS